MKRIQKDRSDLNWIKFDKSEDNKTKFERNISEQQRTKHKIKYRLNMIEQNWMMCFSTVETRHILDVYLACPHYSIIHAISLFLCDFMIWHLEIHLHINYTIFPFSSISCFPVSFCILMSQICPPLSLCCRASAQHEAVYATCSNHCSSTGTNGDRKHSTHWLAQTWEMGTGRALPPKWDVALLPSLLSVTFK